jgi:hypothetical protein
MSGSPPGHVPGGNQERSGYTRAREYHVSSNSCVTNAAVPSLGQPPCRTPGTQTNEQPSSLLAELRRLRKGFAVSRSSRPEGGVAGKSSSATTQSYASASTAASTCAVSSRAVAIVGRRRSTAIGSPMRTLTGRRGRNCLVFRSRTCTSGRRARARAAPPLGARSGCPRASRCRAGTCRGPLPRRAARRHGSSRRCRRCHARPGRSR